MIKSDLSFRHSSANKSQPELSRYAKSMQKEPKSTILETIIEMRTVIFSLLGNGLMGNSKDSSSIRLTFQ